MSQVKGISSGEPAPRPHDDPAPEAGPEHHTSSERRPSGELESTILAALWAAARP